MLSVIESATWSTSRSLPPSTDTCKDDTHARKYSEDDAFQVGFDHRPQRSLPKDPVTIMATRVDHYYISDAEMMREDPETLDALEDLMHKVTQTPGMTVAVYETPSVLHGIKVVVRKVVRKESNNA